MRLAGKKALMIGAATGIGRAAAIQFADNGADLVIADINLPAAEETAAGLARTGRHASAIACDVCLEASVRDAVAAAESRMGGIDTLVVFAGLQRLGHAEQFSHRELMRSALRLLAEAHEAAGNSAAALALFRRYHRLTLAQRDRAAHTGPG